MQQKCFVLDLIPIVVCKSHLKEAISKQEHDRKALHWKTTPGQKQPKKLLSGSPKLAQVTGKISDRSCGSEIPSAQRKIKSIFSAKKIYRGQNTFYANVCCQSYSSPTLQRTTLPRRRATLQRIHVVISLPITLEINSNASPKFLTFCITSIGFAKRNLIIQISLLYFSLQL